MFGDSAILITAKKMSNLKQENDKGCDGYDVLKTNYNYSRIRWYIFLDWKLHCFGARNGWLYTP